MKLIPLVPVESDQELTVLFLNGGGQVPFSLNHRLVKFFNNSRSNLISVELPGHGTSSFEESMNQIEFLKHFKAELKNIFVDLPKTKYYLVGFSLGGLLALKAIEMKLIDPAFTLVYGCGFTVHESNYSTLKFYTSQDFFESMNWLKIMKKNHGSGWKHLIETFSDIIVPNSSIFSDPKKLDGSSILLILGDSDEIFDFETNHAFVKDHRNINVVALKDASHFDYTTKRWVDFKAIVEASIFR